MVSTSNAVIDVLNALWTVKRALIDQNVARSKVCEARGLRPHAERFSTLAFGHMREVSKMLDRIVELEGLPELQTVASVPLGDALAEQLRLSLEAERATTARYHETLAVCDRHHDTATHAIVSDALDRQREHVEWLEQELERSTSRA